MTTMYRIFVCAIWILLFTLVISNYKEIKLDDVPVTTLDFDIAIHEGAVPGERGVFYYDTGKGFNKDEVVVCEYSETQGKDFEHYSVTLVTNQPILRLRFDPLESSGIVTIKDLIVRKYIEEQVDFSRFNSQKEELFSIENISVTRNSLTITTKGEDPHFTLIDNFVFYQKENR